MIRWLALAFALSALAVAAVWLGVMILQPAKLGPLLTEGARKTDKLPVAALLARPVRVIRLAGEPPPAEIPLPPPPPQRDLLEADQPADTLAPVPRYRRHDPCARYGGHRVVTHGGRHWHCRHG